MELWRVTVVDGEFGRDAGFAIVWAADSEDAADVVVEFLKNDTAYGKPYVVKDVVRHAATDRPHVLVFNWADWDDYPPRHDTP